MLAVIDRLWVEHLTAMDDLREGVGLQAYGQRDPLVVYKTEGYRMFQQLLDQHPARRRPHDLPGAAGRCPAAGPDAPDRGGDQPTAAENGATARAGPRKIGAERPLPLRQRQEVQALPRRPGRARAGSPRRTRRPGPEIVARASGPR